MAKDPEQRFGTAREFADTLRAEIVVAPVGRRRVAVLPPVNATNDPDQQFLVLGLHESLISQLGLGDVAVLARTSVLQYQQTDKPARDICRELAVDALVESSLIRAGDAVAIHARLVEGNTGEGVWSGSSEGDVRDVLSLYRRLSESIAAKVHGALRPGRRPIGPRATVDPAAYENYMRGRVHQQNFTPHDLDRALKYYEAALDIQPDYAAVYAGIALIWGSKLVLGMASALEAGPRYRESARRAVELDPNLAEGHQAQAQVAYVLEYDW
jgi:TolB-like protein